MTIRAKAGAKEYDQLDAERQSSKMPLDVAKKLCMLIANWA